MPFVFALKKAELKAILACASADSSRANLTRVRFEPHTNTIIATDGKCMCVVKFAANAESGEPAFEIDAQHLRSLAPYAEVVISCPSKDGGISVSDHLGAVLLRLQKAAPGCEFPHWNEVAGWPMDENGNPARAGVRRVGMDPVLLAKALAMAKAFGHRQIIFEFASNGLDPIHVLIESHENIVAGLNRGDVSILFVLMPMRVD